MHIMHTGSFTLFVQKSEWNLEDWTRKQDNIKKGLKSVRCEMVYMVSVPLSVSTSLLPVVFYIIYSSVVVK
jgi:hypothetical protein